MAAPLAPVLVSALVRLATLDADLGLRADTISSAVDSPNAPVVGGTTASGTGRGALILSTERLQLTADYAARVWASDVGGERPTPLVNHAADLRLETQHDLPWRLSANVGVVSGWTEPFLEASRAEAGTTPGTGQLPTIHPMRYEEFQAGAGGEAPIGARTTLGVTAAAESSRTFGPDAALFPPQRGASATAALSHLLTERDSLRLSASAGTTITDPSAAAGTVRSQSGTALVTWRRLFSPILQGWVGAGASVLYSDLLPPGQRIEVDPAGEVGLVRGGADSRTTIEVSLQATTSVDRFTGQVVPWVEGRSVVTWAATERLTLAADASGGGSTNGATTVGRAAARASWSVREGFALEMGVMGLTQHENEPGLPSFTEVGVFAALVYRWDRIFGTAPDAAAGAAGRAGAPGGAQGHSAQDRGNR